jgi:hypothetical protein
MELSRFAAVLLVVLGSFFSGLVARVPCWLPHLDVNWCLFFATAITGGFIAWQAILTRRAIVVARETANAAVAAERAWVVAELHPTCVNSGGVWHRREDKDANRESKMPLEDTLRGKHWNQKLKLTNMGRTPATVLSFELEHRALGDGGIDDPVSEPIKEFNNQQFDRVLIAGESGCGPWSIARSTGLGSMVAEFSFRYIFSPLDQGLTKVPTLQNQNRKPS